MSQTCLFSLFSRVIAAGVGLLLSLGASACAPPPPPKPVEHPIVRLAMFDLDCPRNEIEYTQINETTWGVSGCGKRTKYMRVCRQVWTGHFASDECRWVQN
jgi:hypothetical protein